MGGPGDASKKEKNSYKVMVLLFLVTILTFQCGGVWLFRHGLVLGCFIHWGCGEVWKGVLTKTVKLFYSVSLMHFN